MRYGSVCSGIEAATVAWHSLGFDPAWFSEIEAFPSAVLAHHYPAVPNLGDMTKIQQSEVFRGSAIDLLVGGTPCQSFSVAGLRKGLADPRGNLALHFLALADAARPRWVVWENVPGVLSSHGGRDFGAFLGGLGELGYGWAYRVLDAQYFGVAQRRRRVFVVGYLGDWRRAAAVLFERDCLSGHPAPSRGARPNVAALTASGVGTCGADDNQAQAGHLVPGLMVAHTLRGEGFDASEDGTGRGIPLVPAQISGVDLQNTRLSGDLCGTLDTTTPWRGGGQAVMVPTLAGCNTAREGKGPDSDVTTTLIPFDPTQITSRENRSNPRPGDPCHTLAKGAHAPAIAFNARQDPIHSTDVFNPLGAKDLGHGQAVPQGVRRLTPRECERLQGFPDDCTLIPYRGKPAADGPRYKALGNSMAVPVMRWIGERIAAVDALNP